MPNTNCNSYIGKQVGNYTLKELLGRGRFACVYLAVHKHLPSHIVAIKLLDPRYLGSPTEEDFRREAEILQKLKHPHILSLQDFGKSEGTFYIIAEYAPRETLEKRITGIPLATEQAVSILTQVGEAVHTAHQQGIVHCDIKPANILFKEENNAILADFGIAIQLPPGSDITTIPDIRGTYLYMAPEQFDGKITKWADQYSLGCIAYELFTGNYPFSQISSLKSDDPRLHDPKYMKNIHESESLRSLRELNEALPEHIEQATIKAMAKEYGRRHTTVKEFIDLLLQTTTSPAGINAYGRPSQTQNLTQALLDLRLPKELQTLLSKPLADLDLILVEDKIRDPFTFKPRLYTQVRHKADKEKASQHQYRALIYIPDWILGDGSDENVNAISRMASWFNSNSVVIIVSDLPTRPAPQVRRVLEDEWQKGKQIKTRPIYQQEIDELRSLESEDRELWVTKELELEELIERAEKSMSVQQMDGNDTDTLVTIIWQRLLQYTDEAVRGWRNLLQGANLGAIAGELDLKGAPETIARELVQYLKLRARLPEEPNHEVLGLLLCHILTLGDLPLKDCESIKQIIKKYTLVPPDDNCSKLI